jgi:RHS repeat-associated protein
VFYVGNGARAVAQLTVVEGVALSQQELLYLHADHLGSTALTTTAQGTVGDTLSFDPFGKPRNPTNWTSDATLDPKMTIGFTGHEQPDEAGLVNMIGRMYDPVIGRFVSADPFVQAPGFSQSLNRYSYVMNNPLKMVDPSGYFYIDIGVNVAAILNSVYGWASREAEIRGAEISRQLAYLPHTVSDKVGGEGSSYLGSAKTDTQGPTGETQGIDWEQFDNDVGLSEKSKKEAAFFDWNIRTPFDQGTETRLNELNPGLRPIALEHLREMRAQGLDPRILEKGGLRTYQQQDSLYAQGRPGGPPGSKHVTNAQGGESYHNFAAAYDVTQFKNGAPNWNGTRKYFKHPIEATRVGLGRPESA